MRTSRLVICSFLVLILTGGVSRAQNFKLDYNPKILLVTAHPDDDALFSATVFKTTYLLNGSVDLALMTNGEGGYKYSTLGNYIYGKQLDKESVGRAQLPGIRKKELMAGGDVVGIRNYLFFDQKDDEYELDASIPLSHWNTEYIIKRLSKLMREEQYDFVFTMMPSPQTHAHHKASAILALRAVKSLPKEQRPVILSATILRQKSESTSFTQLEGYPVTKLNRDIKPFTFDRTQKFGHDNRLDYNIIANWVIAEHKSQGTMQQLMGEGMIEQYWFYAINPSSKEEKVRRFFNAVNAVPMYSDPNKIDS